MRGRPPSHAPVRSENRRKRSAATSSSGSSTRRGAQEGPGSTVEPATRRPIRPIAALGLVAIAGPLVLTACAGQRNRAARRRSGSPPGSPERGPGRPSGRSSPTTPSSTGPWPPIVRPGSSGRPARCWPTTPPPETAICPPRTASSPPFWRTPTRTHSAGNDCYNGAAGNASLPDARPTSVVGRSGSGPSGQRIAAVTGKVPSTTTTTSPGGNDDPFDPS